MSSNSDLYKTAFKKNDQEYKIGRCDDLTLDEAIKRALEVSKKIYKKVYFYAWMMEYYVSPIIPNCGKIRAIVYPEGRIEYAASLK